MTRSGPVAAAVISMHIPHTRVSELTRPFPTTEERPSSISAFGAAPNDHRNIMLFHLWTLLVALTSFCNRHYPRRRVVA